MSSLLTVVRFKIQGQQVWLGVTERLTDPVALFNPVNPPDKFLALVIFIILYDDFTGFEMYADLFA